jgi:hypothetical protein
VARPNIEEKVSPYYPPRARWYSPLLSLGNAVRRRTYLDRLHLPSGIPVRHFIPGLLLPGMAFYLRGERLIGLAVFLGCGVLAATFIVWLGYPVANVAFGLLLSAHATSVLFLLNPWLAGARFIFRIVFGLAVLLLVGGCIYGPLRNEFQAHYLMPIRINEQVVVVRRSSSPDSVKRGDWIAYSIRGGGGEGMYVARGWGLGPVLATAGDQIRFTTNGFAVNGVVQALRPHMPTKGELMVPRNCWFIWPDLAINGNGNAAAITSTMLELATVPESAFFGRAFNRWFWRRQILP